ncbi:MAG: conserved hypothetical protein (putative transposase or invertase) [Candidatus Kentron sp. G]|nr:MAG: conserved hypothetical protein (putative transposase or invertase) [Candidatus Kentron sp. G]VFN05168.1 MAG: conserved hypothetical protein (putative transposase or invertase) [Candidatus Kentron sp. G]VFN05537.1 MAG: conserved hypothetical protein (putative transposase or invertase) [Candidatus Kentron sp. G]
MTDDIAHPYDRFMKELLSQPERAGMLLRERLPKAVTRHMSNELPEPMQDSFVDERLREYFSDRLFRVKTVNGQSAFLYVLIEHKSSPDKKVGWQLLRYMVEILKQWEKENPDWERLPAIVPFVFYHGAEDWKIPNEFLHLVDAEKGWEPYLLNFRFPVLDLGMVPDTELSEHPRLRPWLAAMKYATRKDRQAVVVELLIELLKGAPEDLRSIICYLMNVYPYDKQTLEGIIREVRPGEEEKMMSQFAQEIEKRTRQSALQEGIQQGIQQGEHKKAVEMARTLLNKEMDISDISEISGLSVEELRKLLTH